MMRRIVWGIAAAGSLFAAYLLWRNRDEWISRLQPILGAIDEDDEAREEEPPPRVLH